MTTSVVLFFFSFPPSYCISRLETATLRPRFRYECLNKLGMFFVEIEFKMLSALILKEIVWKFIETLNSNRSIMTVGYDIICVP